MSGNNRTVLLYSGLIRVMSLSLDTEDKRVFWADYERHTVETCGYDGSDRRVLRRMNGVPITGLQFYEVTTFLSSQFRGMYMQYVTFLTLV